MATASLNSGDTNCDQGGVGWGGTAPRRVICAWAGTASTRHAAGLGGQPRWRRRRRGSPARPWPRARPALCAAEGSAGSAPRRRAVGAADAVDGPGARARAALAELPADAAGRPAAAAGAQVCTRGSCRRSCAAPCSCRAACCKRSRAHQGGEKSWLLLQQLLIGDPRRRCAERWPRDTVRVDVHLRRRSASMTMSSPCAPATPCADRRHRHATAICAAKCSRRSRTPAALSPHSLRNLVRGLHRLVLRVRIPRTRAGATHTHTEEVLWCTRTWLSTAPEYLSRVCSCMCAQVRRVNTMRTPRAPKRGNTCLWCAKCYVQHSTSPRNRNPANRNHLDICLGRSQKNRNSLTGVLVALTVCFTYPARYRVSAEWRRTSGNCES